MDCLTCHSHGLRRCYVVISERHSTQLHNRVGRLHYYDYILPSSASTSTLPCRRPQSDIFSYGTWWRFSNWITELPDIKAAFPSSHPTQFVGWHRMTCQIIHFTRPATLKNSSLLTHISQWQYKVGFTTWTTPCGLPLLTVYKPYDLFSYDTRAATGWNSCTGHYKREHSIIYISCNFDTRLMEEKDQDFDSCMQAPLIFNVRISYTFHRCNCNYKAVVSQWYLQ